VVDLILVQLFALILLAWIAALVCDRVKVPRVIGEILIGIAISNIVLNGTSLFSALQLGAPDTSFVFKVFSELGVIFLLFAIGLETPFTELRKVGKMATIVAILGVVLPFIGGFALLILFAKTTLEAMFIGAAMVATSVGITARVIKDLGLMDTIEAKVIIGAAVIDDVLGLIVLAMVTGVAQGGTLNLIDIAVVASLAVVFVLVVMFISALIPKARKRSQVQELLNKSSTWKHWSPLPFALIICFGLAALASYLSLAAIIGAFLAGMLFAEFRDIWPTEDKFAPINEFLVPFFFLFIGIQVNLSSFSEASILALVILVTAVAIITKFVGCGLGAKGLGRKSALIVGVGMVPRGEVGIIVASIGLTSGVLDNSLFSVVVAMSLITTLISPALLTFAFNHKNRGKKRKMDLDKDKLEIDQI